MSEHREYWNSFYRSRESQAVPLAPSAFAAWSITQIPPGQPIVEVGFGNARDALFFARQGHPVRGYDYAASAVRQAAGGADGEDLPAGFAELDLYDAGATDRLGREIAASQPLPTLYGRFLIHSLEDHGRHHLFDLAATALGAGGRLFLEFRTGLDRDEEHVFGDDHYRQYLQPEAVEQELRDRGATIVHSEAGRGLAVYKQEDPHVARIVAQWGPGSARGGTPSAS